MCGIAGLFSKNRSADHRQFLVHKMTEALSHRGPDSFGYWSDAAGLSFGHRRLSILDLSEAGHQPMISPVDDSVLIFNGEIYNHEHLKEKLGQQGLSLKGHSDTEALLNHLALFGLEATLAELRGMFAFAWWQPNERRLSLARDRFGEKPLYFGQLGAEFVFASELKSLSENKELPVEIDPQSLGLFLKYNYIPAPHSIYRGIQKLKPGHFLNVHVDQSSDLQQKAYWTPENEIGKEREDFSDAEAIERTKDLLSSSIRQQLVADVPVGILLSSGVDSSLVASLAQAQSAKSLNTFSIGFEDQEYDESAIASQIAKRLGTHHTNYTFNENDLHDLIPTLPRIYDEPFSDSSQLPTVMLSKLVRQKVKVALSGDGADEIFAGYNRHVSLIPIFKKMQRLPKSLRRSLATLTLNESIRKMARFSGYPYVGHKLDKLFTVAMVDTLSDAYDNLISHWDPQEVLLQKQLCPSSRPVEIQNLLDIQIHDTKTYLPDDILVKVDRASMSQSLEVRCPYLDLELFQFAVQLPENSKVDGGQGKMILRKILSEFLPQELIGSKKKGFSVPLDQWFRTSLKEWITDLLSPERIQRQGFFDAKVVQKYLEEHLSGRRDRQYHLWDLVVFQSWLESRK